MSRIYKVYAVRDVIILFVFRSKFVVGSEYFTPQVADQFPQNKERNKKSMVIFCFIILIRALEILIYELVA